MTHERTLRRLLATATVTAVIGLSTLGGAGPTPNPAETAGLRHLAAAEGPLESSA